jgi:hypothetical protein
LLEYYAECSFILFKDTANESRIIKNPSAALSYLKISQTRAESSSLLECYAECSFILFIRKDHYLQCYAESRIRGKHQTLQRYTKLMEKQNKKILFIFIVKMLLHHFV